MPFTGSRLSPSTPLSSKKEMPQQKDCFCLALLTLLPNLLCLGAAGTTGPLNVLEVILIRFHTASTSSFFPPLSASLAPSVLVFFFPSGLR